MMYRIFFKIAKETSILDTPAPDIAVAATVPGIIYSKKVYKEILNKLKSIPKEKRISEMMKMIPETAKDALRWSAPYMPVVIAAGLASHAIRKKIKDRNKSTIQKLMDRFQ